MGSRSFKIRVGDTEHDVAVTLDDSGTHVVVDGNPVEVDEGGAQQMLVRHTDDARQVAVVLEPGPQPTTAWAAGRVVPVEVRTAAQAARDAARSGASRAGPGNAVLEAPMPGRVVRVLVTEGDDIVAEAPIMIVEAMKMENELRANTPGTVATIYVGEGDTVDAGQPLCEIMAHAAPE